MSDKREQRTRRRRILGAGMRSLGRGVLQTMPGYDRAKSWQKTGQDWFDTLGGLKGAAMKLGQIASQYRDFLPEPLVEQLARLQRNAEPWAFERLEPVIDAAWSDEQRALVAHIDHEAMAAASIGQAHRATLADGRELSITELKPFSLRFGIGGELPVGPVAPFLDLLGSIDFTRAPLELDGDAHELEARSFGFALRAGARLHVREWFFATASAEVGLVGTTRWGAELSVGFALM